MQDMRYASIGYCSLSKGTQSDGLMSDTSTEDLTSSSSTEDLKDNKVLENTKETKEVPNESQDSKNLERSTNVYQLQTRCQLYIRWGVLTSFGILLWVALWITDIFNPSPFLKEDLATAKNITLKAGVVKKPVPSPWWFFKIWSYAWDSILLVTTVEALIFLSCVIILIWLETRMKNRRGATSGRLCYDQFYKTLRNVGAKQSDTEDNSYDIDAIKDEWASKEPDIKSHGDDLSKLSQGDVKKLISQDDIEVKSKLVERSKQGLNQREISLTENRIYKPLKGPRNLKRSLQLNGGKNHSVSSRRSNNLPRDLVTSEIIFSQPNFGLGASSRSQNDKTKSFPDQSNLTCSIFNKSTSFMSEKIETWFELPNAHRAEKVIHSFDTELEEFFETRSIPSPPSFSEPTQDLQRFDSRSIGCDCSKGSNTVILNVDYNRGIVSSSPAFRRFLVNLAKDRLSEPYL